MVDKARNKKPGWSLPIYGTDIFCIRPFIGAGWGWPWATKGRYYIGIYFHCGRGLYIQFGWDDYPRRMKRLVDSMTPDQKRIAREILNEIFEESKSDSD